MWSLALGDAHLDGVRVVQLERSYNDVRMGDHHDASAQRKKVVRRKAAEWLRKAVLQMAPTGTDEKKMLAEYTATVGAC
jgi:hypothetical protein